MGRISHAQYASMGITHPKRWLDRPIYLRLKKSYTYNRD
jgi:hypothetical protein